MPTAKMYTRALFNAFRGEINPLNDVGSDIKVALLSNSYTPDQDGHEDWADISSHEVDSADYSAISLTGKGLLASAGEVKFDADDVEWSGSISARYAVIYDAGSGKLLCYSDFGQDVTSVNSVFKLEFDADGIFVATVS